MTTPDDTARALLVALGDVVPAASVGFAQQELDAGEPFLALYSLLYAGASGGRPISARLAREAASQIDSAYAADDPEAIRMHGFLARIPVAATT